MKIELIKEDEYGKYPWYEIRLDDIFIKGSFDLKLIEKQYAEIVDDPKIVEKKKEILKSEEIVLSLQEETPIETKTEKDE